MADLIHNALPMPRRNIISIRPDDPVKKSIDMMTEYDIGALVVMDNENQLVGIVSERDIVRSCLHKCIDLETAKVGDVVNKDVTILYSNDVVEKAMQAMTATKRRHVLVRDENDDLIAILSIGDVLYHLLEDKARVIEQLENYIHTY
ncbi:CBS domain-containing protein [Fluoribacter dumoffii]|uniref:Hypoxic response protein 1 n=1 Tax=Fluoribacter dumoffii TaxID=463 RepID=A0A377GBL5_9GAMM|nr:CBS domain-containing protein [Fluoribacter dumoffii]KTC88602.1 CBS domain protein [Fluoribacter dumoffii NY 23]MCW8386105.1 CBS domain-containing protein [Fluoribacter dumoffii]MCW8419157.1 CBS domain-containing protein [Fluoribacter dumoffii]MCW8452999.1 CBS domain-containing protein [Fluoribacter dumoffii]MCW8459783.1 CBS domain-containing protein [Fluoribacter dumoffii]